MGQYLIVHMLASHKISSMCKGAVFAWCYCTDPMFLLVDNSDSPSLVEQLQQGCDSGCYTLLAIIPSSVKCLMPYACQLASYSMGIPC